MRVDKPEVCLIDLRLRFKILFFGAIAQLGERYTGSVEVGGSNPPGSTISPRNKSFYPPPNLAVRAQKIVNLRYNIILLVQE